MNTEDEATLAALQEDFPGFYITLEPTGTGPRYIARSRDLGGSPHTLVTPDPGELRATLAAASASVPRLPLPRRGRED